MQQPVENIPMTEQQTDANWRQVHPGGERKEMSQKIQNEQRWNHSHKTQKEQRWNQSFNEEESSQKRLSKDGFQAAGVTKGAIYLTVNDKKVKVNDKWGERIISKIFILKKCQQIKQIA